MSLNYQTSIGTSTRDHIQLLGQDLANDLMGQVSFGDLAFWLVALRRPSPGESRVFNAVLVALADHGLTPTVIAARSTLASAPESLQGAMASGLLGGGSRLLGVTEDVAKFLAEGIDHHLEDDHQPTEAEFDAIARNMLRRHHEEHRKIPGLGHPIHKNGDPRTPVLYQIAREEGLLGPHLALLASIDQVHPEVLGRRLPVNGAGVCGAALADLGFPPHLVRGFALVARAAGLLGHLAEEVRNPLAMNLYEEVDRNAQYVAPHSAGEE